MSVRHTEMSSILFVLSPGSSIEQIMVQAGERFESRVEVLDCFATKEIFQSPRTLSRTQDKRHHYFAQYSSVRGSGLKLERIWRCEKKQTVSL